MATVSVTIHVAVLAGYFCSVRVANAFDTVGTTIQSVELVSQLVLWAVVTSIYKKEKEITTNGKHNDLWVGLSPFLVHLFKHPNADVAHRDGHAPVRPKPSKAPSKASSRSIPIAISSLPPGTQALLKSSVWYLRLSLCSWRSDDGSSRRH